MSDDRPRDASRDEIDWRSPRWRDGDSQQGDEEREHRFRDDNAPPERGAIDRDGSVGGGQQRDRIEDAEPG